MVDLSFLFARAFVEAVNENTNNKNDVEFNVKIKNEISIKNLIEMVNNCYILTLFNLLIMCLHVSVGSRK